MNGEARPPTMTYAQVAALCGRSVSTIEKWVKTGLIPFHRVGRNVRFDPAEIRRWLDENDIQGDNRIQPVHPLRRGGAQYVYPHQTLGDDVHCWCGQLLDHDWEGKDRGAPHPHEHEGIQQVVVVEQQANNPAPEWRRIEKGAMRGFHATLKAFLVQCINTDRLPWRAINNGILLFPPDGSNAISVYCRNNDSQVRSLRTWYAAHVEPWLKADDEDLQRLAETVNDPVEHPAREPDPEPEPAEDEWHPYLHSGGEVSQWFETDGTIVRCRVCVGTGTAYETTVDEVRGLGGHIRMAHRDTEALRTPEALAKAVDSKRYNRLHEKVLVAVELLAETVGYGGSTAELERENERLKTELAAEKQRADDAEARVRLMKEAFRGLE